jgi:hypothetical protein
MGRVAGKRRIGTGLAMCVSVSALLSVPAFAATESTEECVARRIADGESRAEAMTACLREGAETTVVATTVPPTVPATVPRGGLDTGDTTSPAASDDDGTSPVALIVVGVIGLVIGAAAATVLARRRRAPATPSGSSATPAPASAPLQPPTAAPSAPQADRSPGLITSLIDLSDRMTSQALRAEIIATLGRVGVHPIEIAPGTPFEATTMRGIGSSPTSDPAWVGRVATTDRCGFHDAGRVIRLPDVVVYVAG